MTDTDIKQQMDAMRTLDEPMPQVGIFWYDLKDRAFFGVRKQELTPEQAEEAAEMIEEEFALPYFEFVYDEHWNLGHGWSGDM